MNATRVWIVFNPDRATSFPPKYVHSSYFNANLEAKRLASENPGYVFHVMASCEAHCKQDVATVTFDPDFTENSGDVPF